MAKKPPDEGPGPGGTYKMKYPHRSPTSRGPMREPKEGWESYSRRKTGPPQKAAPVKHDTCRRGHPFTTENTIRKAEGGRKCRTCFNAAARARKAGK
jgi:hypothetical protein